ncbi:fimbrial protein [Stenotrophomonas lactitubi]|uniref:fimbrial protein n=1 Tax=Stenotrophomonas lactitubi TaxID=2045214 RepID=UPI003207A1DB
MINSSDLSIQNTARFAALTIAALLTWRPEHALAQQNSAVQRLCKGGSTYTLALPAAVTVPRDAPVGTMLLAPVVGAEFPTLYQCTNSTRDNAAGVARRSLNLTRSGVTVSYSLGGANISNSPVYNTGLPGVGMVIAFRALDTGCPPDFWHDVDTDGSRKGPIEGWASSGCNGDGPGQIANAGGQWAIGLVKTLPIVQPGMIAGGLVMELSIAQKDSNSESYYIAKNPEVRRSFVGRSPIQVNVLSCSTPSITVPMGDHPKSAFKGVGSITNPVRFKVAINSCPAAMKSVTIRLAEPNKRYVNAAQGVVQLSSDSTAKGIGLKLTQASDGTPMLLEGGAGYLLRGYDPAKGGGLEILFDAAYYQALPNVIPGTANAVIEFTMGYQ